MTTKYDDVWVNITFPVEDYSSEELTEFLQDIIDWVSKNKPSRVDIDAHFETTNWGDFCKKYPLLIDVWRNKIEAALA
jgi:hypothetical protein